MVLFSFGMALVNTGITALISNAASDREQGVVLGTSSSLDSLSGFWRRRFPRGCLAGCGPAYAGVESLTFMSTIALVMGLLVGARSESAGVLKDDATLDLLRETEAARIADG